MQVNLKLFFYNFNLSNEQKKIEQRNTSAVDVIDFDFVISTVEIKIKKTYRFEIDKKKKEKKFNLI